MLVQIEKCLQYSEKFNRSLLIDTGNCGGISDLSLFFEIDTSKADVIATKEKLTELNQMVCSPDILSGRLSNYKTSSIRDEYGLWVCCEHDSLTPLSINFSNDYSEPLIVHDSWGGGIESAKFLRRVKVEHQLSNFVLKSIAELGENYAAIHIRNTDYKTDWRQFLKRIRRRLKGRIVLLCSDSSEVRRLAPSILNESQVRSVSNIFYDDEMPLHQGRNVSESMKNASFRSSLIDLFALGGASELFISPVRGGQISGFSRLAALICEDKTILASLLGEHRYLSPNPRGQVIVCYPLQNRLRSLAPQFKRFLKEYVMFFGFGS